MAATTRTDDQNSPTDPELYLPAGITPTAEANWLERLWGQLFTHGVEPPK